jgi:selenophosphate synthetase-related protein
MLLEFAHLGVTVALDQLPRPAGVDLPLWLTCFPCFAFLLCVPSGREEQCTRLFSERNLRAAAVGVLDESGQVRVGINGRAATVFDLRGESVTGLV